MILVTLIIIISIQGLVCEFPTHNPKDDVMVNPTFDPRDKKACGLFKPPPSTSGRVWKGEEPYPGQFPWAVCLLEVVGPHMFKNLINMKTDLYDRLSEIEFNIHDVGEYEYSKNKGTIYAHRVRGWKEFCTGSIIDEHWVITAAHCFMSYWEGMFFAVNPSKINVCNDGGNEETKTIIASRLDPYKTIFEHPNFLSSKSTDMGADIALVRINDGFKLPVESYNNELINRICIYSFIDLPNKGCLRNVYFSGFGMKRDISQPDPQDPQSNMTWFKVSRMNDGFCLKHGHWIKPDNIDNVNCYSSVPEHASLKDSAGIDKAAVKNKTAAENYQNTCPGDSGGPFMYYMKYDKDGDHGQSGYRALLLSTLSGGDWREGKTGRFYCTTNWFQDEVKFLGLFTKIVYFRTIERATLVRSKLNSSWFRSAMEYRHSGQTLPAGNFKRYPGHH